MIALKTAVSRRSMAISGPRPPKELPNPSSRVMERPLIKHTVREWVRPTMSRV